MATTRVLHLLGIDDTNTVTVLRLTPTLHPHDLSFAGNVEVLNLLEGSDLQIDHLVLGGMEGTDLEIIRPDVIFSAICDPDTNQASLAVAERVAAALRVPVLNAPAGIRRTTRDQISEILADVPGVVAPRTIRVRPRRVAEVAALIESGELAAPLLFRPAGAHGGDGLTHLAGADDLSALDAFALDGRAYYLTEFVDFASTDGRYRKHRAIVVGGRPYPRHKIISDHWNVHAESRSVLMADDAALRDEEARFLTDFEPDEWPVFAAIYERLGLDYFGVDFGVLPDGRVVLFEVNACVRALVDSQPGMDTQHHERALSAIKAALADLITARGVVAK
jgi:glutathione synthase/RimK-type ligase-like ATP-grasp enzyme